MDNSKLPGLVRSATARYHNPVDYDRPRPARTRAS
jgi:hypothetical protein